MQPLSLEYLDVSQGNRRLRIAINAERSDTYLDRLRKGGGRQPIAELLCSLTAPGDAVIDAGANVGLVSLPVAAEGRRVLAIEAMAENYVALLSSVCTNGLSSVTPVHAAVTGCASLLDIEGSSAYARVKISDKPGPTPGVTLDQLAQAHGFDGATAMKLDVEGSEMDALDGADGLLRSSSLQSVVYEANGAHCTRVGYRPLALADRLERYGFGVHLIVGTTLVPASTLTFQPIGNTDYLAIRPGVAIPQGYSVGEIDSGVVIQGIVQALENPNRGYRAFMVGELAYAPSEVVSRREIRDALAAIATDDDSAEPVRAAARRLLDQAPAVE